MKKLSISFIAMMALVFSVSGLCMSFFNNDLDDELDKMKQGITEEIITDGERLGLVVGDSKEKILTQLRALDIQYISPFLAESIEVTKPKNLYLLDDSEGIILFPGDIRISFQGDEVKSREIMPSVDEKHRKELELAESRSQVFEVLEGIMKTNARAILGNYLINDDPIYLDKIVGTSDERYDGHCCFKFGLVNEEGFWDISLFFKQDTLAKMRVMHSPVELP